MFWTVIQLTDRATVLIIQHTEQCLLFASTFQSYLHFADSIALLTWLQLLSQKLTVRLWGERQHQITIFSACSRSFQCLCDSFAQTKHASLEGLNSRAMDLLTNEPLITSKPILNRVHTMLIKSFTVDKSAHIWLLNQSEPEVYWCCLYLTAPGFNKMGRMGNLTTVIGPSNTLMLIKRCWEVFMSFAYKLLKRFLKNPAPIIK